MTLYSSFVYTLINIVLCCFLSVTTIVSVMSEQDKETMTPSLPGTVVVTFKPPPIDESSVTRWFTKFHHILSNLPVKIVSQLSDNEVNSLYYVYYDQLIKELGSLFTRSK